MPEQESPKLRKVAWSELLPWLNLVRCFRIAIQARLLLCGGFGVFLTLSGWAFLGYLFYGSEAVRRDAEPVLACPWLAATEMIGDQPGRFAPRMGVPPGDVSPVLPAPGRTDSAARPRGRLLTAAGQYNAFHPFWGIWEHLSAPWRNLFDPNGPAMGVTDRLSRFVFLFLGGLWALAVWALFGGVITRAAAVELATRDRAKTVRTFRYAASKWPSYFAAPFFPLMGVLLIGLPIAVTGLLLRAEIVGWIAAVVWPLLLVDGFLMALLLAGLLFGWPLMWANISVEGVDSFDAVGRAYSYVFQRPLQYLFYALVATVLGALGWLFVWNFVAAIVGVTYGAAAWGAGTARVEMLLSPSADLGWLDSFTAWLISFWVQCLKLLGVGFLYSFFWTSSTAIYYLLRRDADATEMDEVCPEDEEQPADPAATPAPAGSVSTPPSEETLPKDQAE